MPQDKGGRKKKEKVKAIDTLLDDQAKLIQQLSDRIANLEADEGGSVFDLLSDTELSGNAASIDITGIPATYKHLKLIGSLRGDVALTAVTLLMRFNNDSGANYDSISYTVHHSAVIATTESFAGTSFNAGAVAGGTSPANTMHLLDVIIPDYLESTRLHTFINNFFRQDTTTTGNIFAGAYAGRWRTAGAIDRITLLPASGNFVSGTRISLYGIN